MPKITLLHDAAGYLAGQTVDVPEDQAEALVAGDYAVYAEENDDA